jgi:hypothetical protein
MTQRLAAKGRARAGTADALVSAYSALLTDHDRASAEGTPLLTEAGAAHVRRLILAGRAGRGGPAAGPPLPHWDGVRRQLWLGPQLLKEFRQPAPAQVAVLAAFEARGWAAGHAPDPIPHEAGESDEEVRHRLHDTVKNLNRGIQPGTIRFRADGGTGLWWEYAAPPAHRAGRRARGSDTGATPTLHPSYPLPASHA